MFTKDGPIVVKLSIGYKSSVSEVRCAIHSVQSIVRFNVVFTACALLTAAGCFKSGASACKQL